MRQSKVLTFKSNDYEVGISLYSDSALIIIHNRIPGVGSILVTEVEDDRIEVRQLMGQQNDMLDLTVRQIAKEFSIPTITFILSFHPSRLQTFDEIRQFINDFKRDVQSLKE